MVRPTLHPLRTLLVGFVLVALFVPVTIRILSRNTDSSDPLAGKVPGEGSEIDSSISSAFARESLQWPEALQREVNRGSLGRNSTPEGWMVSTDRNPSEAPALHGRPPILKVQTLSGQAFGIPIAQFSDESWVMRNDGAIQRIERSSIVHEQVLGLPFEAIHQDQLVEELRKEFGTRFQIRSEGPYVFVTRGSQGLQWANRFRSLYSSMKQFCRLRGFLTREIEFPLIAIVMGNEEEFRQYARAHQATLPNNCVGYYSQHDNRIILFEDPKKMSRQETLDTICHEAAHQLAFNMGLHQRCSGCPLWLAEGFATMFEAPAFSNRDGSGRTQWAASRQGTWSALLRDGKRVSAALDSVIRSDKLFDQDPDVAYAVAWALTHYLATERPRQFGELLVQTGQLPPFVPFHSADRWEHFRRTVGTDMGKLTRELMAHMQSLK